MILCLKNANNNGQGRENDTNQVEVEYLGEGTFRCSPMFASGSEKWSKRKLSACFYEYLDYSDWLSVNL